MGKGDSRLIGHFDIPADAEKNSTSSEDAISCRRINKRMVQSILLIWLDKTIDDTSPDCQNTITQLRRVVNTIKKYNDEKQCLQYLETIQDENAFMITSGSLGQRIVP
jgi:hypothetical protein